MSSRAILVTGLLLLAAVVAGCWLLLANFGSGGEADRNRLEAIRTVATIVLGAGGGVALLLAARRQQTAERDLNTKRRDLDLRERDLKFRGQDIEARERADAAAVHDSEERRMTELYTKAAEMLGAPQAAVRMAGLYALQRLAQNHPSQRRPVVNVLCAYLRMPFVEGVPSPLRDDTGMEDVAKHLLTIEGQREREVRVAAQGLLLDHVLNSPSEDVPDRPRYWGNDEPDGGLTVDLSGATLFSFDVSGRTLHPNVQFSDAVFYGPAFFDHANFTSEALFRSATFDSEVSFEGALFKCGADFEGAHFNSDAFFDEARFCAPANRERSSAQIDFSYVNFRGDARFDAAIFDLLVTFAWAVFERDALFRSVDFVDAYFNRASFHEDARFYKSKFLTTPSFEGATARLKEEFSWPPHLRLAPLLRDEAPGQEDGWGVVERIPE